MIKNQFKGPLVVCVAIVQLNPVFTDPRCQMEEPALYRRSLYSSGAWAANPESDVSVRVARTTKDKSHSVHHVIAESHRLIHCFVFFEFFFIFYLIAPSSSVQMCLFKSLEEVWSLDPQSVSVVNASVLSRHNDYTITMCVDLYNNY